MVSKAKPKAEKKGIDPKASLVRETRRFLAELRRLHLDCRDAQHEGLAQEDSLRAWLQGLFLYLLARRKGQPLEQAEAQFRHVLLQRSLVHEGTTHQPRLLCESHLLYALRLRGEKRPTLERLQEMWSLFLHFAPDRLMTDPLGDAYQSLQGERERKKIGQFFTPPDLVRLAMESFKATDDPDFRVMDPACGSGAFLLEAYDRMVRFYRDQGHSPTQSHHAVVTRHLRGMDLDPTAVVLAEMNLFLRCPQADPLPFPLRCGNFLSQEDPESLDWIIGNPPWGGSVELESSEASALEPKPPCQALVSQVGSRNPFAWFIHRSLSLLKPKGVLSFLVPDALLDVKQYAPLRKQILTRSSLRRLVLCGHRFRSLYAPVLLLETCKHEGFPKDEAVCIAHYHAAEKKAQPVNRLAPSLFHTSPETVFNVAWRDDLEPVWRAMESGASYFQRRASFGLGIVTGNNKKFLHDAPAHDGEEGILVGTDVQPCFLKEPSRFIGFEPETFQQVCPEGLFRSTPKLVYRFISRRLCFAVDTQGRLTLNNTNLLISHIPNLDTTYLCGVLNSLPMQSYYQHHVISVKVLRANLERLPLAAVGHDLQQPVIEAVGRIQQAMHAGSTGDELEALQVVLDEAVMDCYGLSKRERRLLRQVGLPRIPGR